MYPLVWALDGAVLLMYGVVLEVAGVREACCLHFICPLVYCWKEFAVLVGIDGDHLVDGHESRLQM